ncbi:MAG: phosphatase PAP2 family protein [Dokdonella sp.]
MDRRLLGWVAVVSTLLTALGLAGADRPLAEWVHASGIEQARAFSLGLGALDVATGVHIWYWLAGSVVLTVGIVACAVRRDLRWPRMLVAAGCVQFACIGTMILGKTWFGRLRPQQVFESGDWAHVWFAGGGSFPSGHSAFYFGLLLPLAAACPARWQRLAVLAIPLYVVLARIDLAKHFLSDVAASALLAAVYALILATLIRRWLPPPSPQPALSAA